MTQTQVSFSNNPKQRGPSAQASCQRVPSAQTGKQRPLSETIAGASLKTDAVAHEGDETEEIHWACNSRRQRRSHLAGDKCPWRVDV